jgi:hypothetical protein
VYRYLMWVQRPPTWKYFVASWKLFLRPHRLVVNTFHLIRLTISNIVAQKFIANRSKGRWVAHMCLAWGCLLAFAITFPLSWGWVQFNVTEGGLYATQVFGIDVFHFNSHSMVGFFIFNGLNFSAVLVLICVALAMHRRIHERGAQSVQSLTNDLMPLFLLFAVSITGLMLTASYKLMGGSHFSFLSLLHAFTVIVLLLYLPFGKLFHIFQRPAQLGVQFYKEEGARGEQALSLRSGEPYQSKLHHDDMTEVMRTLGIDFGDHQNLSPQDKRKLIAINQLEAKGETGFVG